MLILCCQGCLKAVRKEGPCEASQIASVTDESRPLALGGFLIGTGGVSKDAEQRVATVFKVYAAGDGGFYLDAFVPLKTFLLEEYEQVTAQIMTVPGEEIIVPLQHQRLGLLVKLQQEMEKANQSFPEPGAQQDLLMLETQLSSLLRYEKESVDSEILESALAKMRLRRLRFGVDLTSAKSQPSAQQIDILARLSYYGAITKEQEDDYRSDAIRELYEITEHLLRLQQMDVARRIIGELAKIESHQSQLSTSDLSNLSKHLLKRYGKIVLENCNTDSYEISLSAVSSTGILRKCFQNPEGSSESSSLLVKGIKNSWIGHEVQLSALAQEIDIIFSNPTSASTSSPEIQTVMMRLVKETGSQQEIQTWFSSISLKEYRLSGDSNISHALLGDWPENSEISLEKWAGPLVDFQTLGPKEPLSEVEKNHCDGTAMVTVDHWPIYTLETGCIVFYQEPAESAAERPTDEIGAPPIAEVKEVVLPSGAIEQPVEKEAAANQTPPRASNPPGGVRPPNSTPPEAEGSDEPGTQPAAKGFTPGAGKVPCVQ